MAAGWTADEELLTVNDRGQVDRFTVTGAASTAGETFSLGAACEDERIIDAIVFQDGIVAITASGHLWCVENVAEPRAQRFPDPAPSGGLVHFMAAIPPSVSGSGTLEIVAAVDETLVLIDARGAAPSSVHAGPILRLAVSPDGRYVAGITTDDAVYIWDCNLESTIASKYISETSEIFSDALGLDPSDVPSGVPDAFLWCGNSAVLAAWPGVILMMSVEGSCHWWDIGPGAAFFVSELDGARAVTEERHLFFRQVPPALASVLEIGSTSPGALLYDARKLYDKKDARAAAELLEVLKAGDLSEAVTSCLGAAAAEVDPNTQEALMQASCYGRAFMALQKGSDDNHYAGKTILDVARKLRVINALRNPAIALPLTLPQFNALGLSRLGSRLASRRQYMLAFCVCEALGASTGEVLLRWACDKIQASASSVPDDELLNSLCEKLDGKTGVKWARIAAHARAQGRLHLAADLADKEVCACDQIPLLVELGEDDLALKRAVDSGDPDLVFGVVFSMWRRAGMAGTSGEGRRKVCNVLRQRPLSLSVLKTFLAATEGDGELALWESLGDHAEAADCHVRKAFAASAEQRETESTRQWAKARDAFALAEKTGKDDRFDSAASAAALRLQEFQSDIEKTTGREGFQGLSAVGTVKHCLRLGLRDQAHRVSREFKIPEKQQMLLAVNASAASHEWTNLQQMASKLDRRAPISMEHFVDAARTHGAPLATIRWFVDHITAGDNVLVRRAQLYAELGLHHEAAMLAEQAELQGAGAGVLGSLRDVVGGIIHNKPVGTSYR